MITCAPPAGNESLPPPAARPIIAHVPRRIHVTQVTVGDSELPPTQAHHARDVLRLKAGTAVELFDDAGATAAATILRTSPAGVTVRVERLEEASRAGFTFAVAAAVPKAARPDWMVEKLSELGADAFIPLAAARSVALPEGEGKRDRWQRLAAESAKQSRRRGVMRIEPLTSVADAISNVETGWYLSTSAGATPIGSLVSAPLSGRLTLFIGPEGGWTDDEIARFEEAGLTGVALTATILRVETAAVAAAAVVATMLSALAPPQAPPAPADFVSSPEHSPEKQS